LTEYTFAYEIDVKASNNQTITYLSAPAGTTHQPSEDKTCVKITQEPSQSYPKKALKVYYRTEEMGSPIFLFEENSEYVDEVACMMSFCPTFERKLPQEICENERPQESEISFGKDFYFVFVVDCSGSMSGRRIE